MSSLTQNFLNPNNKPLMIGEFVIRQEESGYYCLNDLHKAGGNDKKHFPAYFLRNQQTKDLIAEIEHSANLHSSENERCANLHIAVKTIKGGSGEQGTYVVKELVYAYAMWVSPKFHLMVIRAYDALVMDWLMNDKMTISPEQCGILYNIVHTRANGNKGTIAQMWSRLKNHFKYSASYRELKAIHFEDAKHYLEVMDLKVKPEKNDGTVVERLENMLASIGSRYPALNNTAAYEAAMKIADDMTYRDATKPLKYYVSFVDGKVITRLLEDRFYPMDIVEMSDIFNKFHSWAMSNNVDEMGRQIKRRMKEQS